MEIDGDAESFWTSEATRSALRVWLEAGLEEDRAREDVTTAPLFPAESPAVRAKVEAREPGVLCGGPAALQVFRLLGEVHEMSCLPEGSSLEAGSEALVIEASPAVILGGERTALNVIGHLSGIASQARRWSEAASGVMVLDTRKTIPGLRRFQKYAVRTGGAHNHREHLADFPLVKENHRDLFRARRGREMPVGEEIGEITRRLRQAAPGRPVEVEVEDLESFLACIEAGVDIVLIDNQRPETIEAWVEESKRRGMAPLPELEASGGITGESIPSFAQSGVARISIGALTHSVRALDFSLGVEWSR